MGFVEAASFFQERLRRIIPREEKFFRQFEQLSSFGKEASSLLLAMVENPAQAGELYPKLDGAEKRADDCVRTVYQMLDRTFITPIDREDIADLAAKLDNIVDGIESVGRTASHIIRHHHGSLSHFRIFLPHTKRLLRILVEATGELFSALPRLSRMEPVSEKHAAIHRLENAADVEWEGEGGVFDSLVALFLRRTDEPFTKGDFLLYLWAEVCHDVERTIDLVKNTIDTVSSIIDKHS